jgi:hypothetical protein
MATADYDLARHALRAAWLVSLLDQGCVQVMVSVTASLMTDQSVGETCSTFRTASSCELAGIPLWATL